MTDQPIQDPALGTLSWPFRFSAPGPNPFELQLVSDGLRTFGEVQGVRVRMVAGNPNLPMGFGFRSEAVQSLAYRNFLNNQALQARLRRERYQRNLARAASFLFGAVSGASIGYLLSEIIRPHRSRKPADITGSPPTAGLEQPIINRRQFMGTVLAGAAGDSALRRLEVEPFVEGVVVDSAARLPQNFGVAAHRDLRRPLVERFPGVTVLPLPHTREGVSGLLERQAVGTLFLDKGLFLDENEARDLLPLEHPPAFLIYSAEVGQLSEAVLATILRLNLPANGLFILRLRQDDMGRAVLDLFV